MMDAPWFHLVLGVLACWRVTHLLALEDGPWNAVLHLRQAAGARWWGRMLDCFHCLSLWVAAALAPLIARSLAEGLLVWLGLSGAACLLQRLGGGAQATLEPLNLQGDSDGLLWTAARGAGDPTHGGGAGPDGPGANAGGIHIAR